MRNKKINICKNIFVLFFVFVLISSIVEANYYWAQEGNANYESSIYGNNYIAYGSNYVNKFNMSHSTDPYGVFGNYSQEGTNYTSCSITKSDYTPVSADFNRDGILDVVVTDLTTNKLSIYDTRCNLIDEIIVEGVHYEGDSPTNITHKQDIVAMPVLMDSDTTCIDYSDTMYPIFELCADYSPEIFVLTNESLKGYTYSFATGGFEESSVENYQNEVDKPLDFLTCFQSIEAGKCFGLSSDENDAIIFPIGSDAISVSNELSHPSNVNKFKYSGLSNTRMPTSLLEFYVPFGFYIPWTVFYFDGELLKDWGDFVFHYTYPYDYSIGFSPNADSYVSSHFVAKQGNLFRLFASQYQQGSYWTGTHWDYNYMSSNAVFDTSGNRLFSEETKDNVYDNIKLSNWVIVDINKDGSNDACFINSTLELICYHPNLGWDLPLLKFNYSSVMDKVNNMVIADFYPNYGGEGWDLCVGTVEGIFCHGEKVFSTGKTGDGFPITVFSDIYSKTPALIYTDDSQGFIIYADIIVDTCGDGLCQYWENQLSCPQDCEEEFEPEEPEDEEGEYREGSQCEQNSDCECNLCEYGFCTLLRAGMVCSSDDCCLSNDCLNGKCTKEGFWSLVDASKSQWMGDDTNTNNVLSLIVMIVVSCLAGSVAIWMGLMCFFALALFFTLVGWLSSIILIGILIVGIIALVFGLIIGAQPH